LKEQKTIAKKAVKKTSHKKVKDASRIVKLSFKIKYHTQFGENIFITANHETFGNNDVAKALHMQYFNEEHWYVNIEVNKADFANKKIIYNYLVKYADGSIVKDWGNDKTIDLTAFQQSEIIYNDSWNYTGYYENAFYTEPFQQVFLKENFTPVKVKQPKIATHIFRIKAPLLLHNQTVCLLGNVASLNGWNTQKPILLNRKEGEYFYSVKIDLSNEEFPIAYKFGIFDTAQKKFLKYEEGKNRVLFDSVSTNKITVVNNGFIQLASNSWKGAGVAIPVFSLKTKNSFGIGEFADIKLLVDWCKQTGLKLIQLLPVNDTTATHTWKDSYPYAAISAFALHPAYLNLNKLTSPKNKKLLKQYEAQQKQLNNLSAIDFEAVMKVKTEIVEQLFSLQKDATFKTAAYQQFFQQNKNWLIPYAAFCYLRDKYKTPDCSKWSTHSVYNETEIEELNANFFNEISIHYFIQYHLHLQLKEVVEYAHANTIIIKGDIAIGVYRYSADVWQQPELFNLQMQAGAPPDDFAVKGQNWGFPTYNWQVMKQNNFEWWKKRFQQMGEYFDAFRIDHILGFFRIWSIPNESVEGIMGHFVPAIPVHINEFHSKNIWFDYHRYTKPFINDETLIELFGDDKKLVEKTFLEYDGAEKLYSLKSEFNTQQKVEKYFFLLEQNKRNEKLKTGLFDLISNVILFEVKGSQAQQFHFRFAIQSTSSFKYLDEKTKQQLNSLYENYFFQKQDVFWKKEAMQKLPALKSSTNMLVCGEDLGLVPSCVPDVMKQLGLLSLEIERMPKDANKKFFHPNDAPYLSVVTPSTHDMSTIRSWWEENRETTQQFYNHELGKWGEAPLQCTVDISKAIINQHLFSPAMWSIFQLQDLLGMNESLRRENADEERINVPANADNYWQYRMHLYVEDLIKANEFNHQLKNSVELSGR
jgi:4-alpha-glucanotransferase